MTIGTESSAWLRFGMILFAIRTDLESIEIVIIWYLMVGLISKRASYHFLFALFSSIKYL